MRPVDGIDNPEITNLLIPSGTDDELVAAAKGGNEPAFEELTLRHRARMFSLALRYARVREDAEDIVLGKFQSKSLFSTWLTRIAINESLMFQRRARSVREISIDEMGETNSGDLEILDCAPNPEARYLQREAAHLLSSAIEQLKPRLRIAIE